MQIPFIALSEFFTQAPDNRGYHALDTPVFELRSPLVTHAGDNPLATIPHLLLPMYSPHNALRFLLPLEINNFDPDPERFDTYTVLGAIHDKLEKLLAAGNELPEGRPARGLRFEAPNTDDHVDTTPQRGRPMDEGTKRFLENAGRDHRESNVLAATLQIYSKWLALCSSYKPVTGVKVGRETNSQGVRLWAIEVQSTSGMHYRLAEVSDRSSDLLDLAESYNYCGYATYRDTLMGVRVTHRLIDDPAFMISNADLQDDFRDSIESNMPFLLERPQQLMIDFQLGMANERYRRVAAE